MLDVAGEEIDDALAIHRNARSHLELHASRITRPILDATIPRARIIAFRMVAYIMRNAHVSIPLTPQQ
jgi:hypothetical protein